MRRISSLAAPPLPAAAAIRLQHRFVAALLCFACPLGPWRLYTRLRWRLPSVAKAAAGTNTCGRWSSQLFTTTAYRTMTPLVRLQAASRQRPNASLPAIASVAS